MEETPLRRSSRIKCLSEDEASVASSTRSTRSREAAAAAPRRAAVVRAGKSNNDKAAKTKRLVAIPEVIDAPVGDVEDDKAVETRKGNQSKASSSGHDDQDVTEPTSTKGAKTKKKSQDKQYIDATTPNPTIDVPVVDKTQKADDSKADSSGHDNVKATKEDVNEPSSTTDAMKKKRGKQSIPPEKLTEDIPTPNPTIPVVTASKKLGKNAAKKLHRKLGDYVKGRKVDAAPPSDTAASSKKEKKSQKRKKLSEGQLNADVATDDSQDITTSASDAKAAQSSKKKRTKVIPPELNPKASGSPKKNASTEKLSKGDEKTNAVEGKSHQSPPPVKTSKLVMDVKVHRMRFLKLQQRAILSMASTPLPSSSSSSVNTPSRSKSRHPVSRLAISREGGSVELLSPHDRWVSVGDIPGVRGREVDAMVWICGKRYVKEEEEDNNNMKVDGGSENVLVGNPDESHLCRLVDENMHLFGCSRDGTIFELDFATKRQKGVIGSGGGGVFCMASLCSRGGCCCSTHVDGGSSITGGCGGYFAAGCEDGTVKIYTAFGSSGGDSASGGLTLVATLPSAGNAILSLAWLPGNSGRDDGGMGGSVLFAGVADGTIRRFDCTTSITTGPISTGSTIALSRGSVSVSYRWKSSFRMTVENRGLREATKVWALKVLTDGTVISGDSLGHIQIWDGMSGTMTQSFDHNENGADVLCLAVSEDENKIFASSVDSSVRCIERQALSVSADADQDAMADFTPVRKWISSLSHRKHSHDVKALAICLKGTNRSKPLELLVSGSVDTRICSYVANDFKGSRPKVWYNWPSRSPISHSCKQRLLAVTRDNRIDLYRVDSPDLADPSKIMCPESRDETKCLVKTISIDSPYNLCCSTISDDGKFLAASDALSLYVFSLEVEDDDGIYDVRPTILGLGGVCRHPATALKFDAYGRLICATVNGPINILKISSISETGANDSRSYSVALEHVFKEHTVGWSCTSHHFPIINLDLSSDGKWLSAGRFSSDKGSVHVFTLSTSDGVGRYQHWWALPESDAPTTCIKFLGDGDIESSLAVGCSTNEFYIFNLDRRALSHWSNDMGLPLLKSLPKELTSRSEPVTRIVSNPASPQCFILVSVCRSTSLPSCIESCITQICSCCIGSGIARIFLCS